MDFATAVFGCGGEPSAPETEFHDVCFRFPNSDALILDHISFKIKRGEKIALVGINGAGETTLIKRSAGCLSRQTATYRRAGKISRDFAPILTMKD